MTVWAGRLGWALVGALALYVVAWHEPIGYPEVIVPAARILEREPPADPGWRDRITHHYIGPTQLARAPGGAADAVQEFCRPLVVVDTVEKIVERRILVRSGVTRDGWWMARDRVDLVALANDAALERWSFDVRPGWDFRASGDSILTRYPRWAILRQGAETFLPAALGFAVCALAR